MLYNVVDRSSNIIVRLLENFNFRIRLFGEISKNYATYNIGTALELQFCGDNKDPS